VTDRTVCAAIAAGARTVQDIARRCTAGACCGGCWPEIELLLDEHRWREAHRDGRAAG